MSGDLKFFPDLFLKQVHGLSPATSSIYMITTCLAWKQERVTVSHVIQYCRAMQPVAVREAITQLVDRNLLSYDKGILGLRSSCLEVADAS